MRIHVRIGASVAAVVTALALFAPAATAATAATAGGRSVAYQIDAGHNGHAANGVAATSLQEAPLWSRELGGNVSYPIVVGNRVFVTASVPDPNSYGTRVYGLNAKTGKDLWAPIDLGGTYWWSALAYGGDRLFVVNYDGLLRAIDPVSGTQVWSVQLPGQWSFTSAPTYSNGIVYTGGAGSGGTLYAISAADGSILWTQSVANGDESSPAVTSTGVYVSYACEQAYAFDPASGGLIWTHSTGCEGGGGRTPAVADGAVWIRDDAGMTPVALRRSDGRERATYQAGPIPAFDGTKGFFLASGTLTARDTSTLTATWSFTGDGQLTSAPIVVSGYVYVGSASGRVWALDETTGQVAWSGLTGAPIAPPDEHNVSQPLTGLGAGGNRIIVPATSRVVAFGASTA